MPIPPFTDFGLLPEGIHVCSPEEIVDRYCANPNRQAIWERFLHCCAELRDLGWVQSVLVDGGFTSDKPVTKDIDVVIDANHLDDASFYSAWVWWVANRQRIMDDLTVDLWLHHQMMPNDLSQFFCYVKEPERLQRGAPEGVRKGLLRISL
ncbi:DUF6932 family protein [Cupriavidus sp. a3]|uniref:DUF6932 family protein n=1 Tax=Cupriavidus sp. a3 TaxID=3242158 RepID=UPI003D9C4312